MSMKEAYRKRMEARILEWEAEIEELRARAAQAGDGAKAQYNEVIEELNERKQKAQDKITEFRNSSEEAWDEVRTGFDRALSELKQTFERAKGKF